MGFLGSIANWLLGREMRSKFSPLHPKDPGLALLYGTGLSTAAGQWVSPEIALQDNVVMACVRVLSESIAQLPLKIYKRQANGGKELAYDHPLYQILANQPNNLQTSFGWRETGMAHLLLRGNYYSYIQYDVAGRVAGLMPLDPDSMYVFLAPDNRRAYQYTSPISGQSAVFLQDEILHIIGLCLYSKSHPSPYSSDGLIGISPIRYARETIGHSLGAREFGSKLFANNAKPGGVLQHPGTLSDAAYNRLKENWLKQQGGSENAHKLALLEEGMTFNPISMTPEDAQFLQTREFTMRDIARIYRVPPHMIGDLSRSTYSNIEQQSIEFVTQTMMPWLIRWEQVINQALFTEAERKASYFCEHLVTGLLRGDAAARSAYYNQMFQIGAMSRNEIRAAENMNPVEGGDKYYVPLNMADANAPMPAKEPEPAAEENKNA